MRKIFKYKKIKNIDRESVIKSLNKNNFVILRGLFKKKDITRVLKKIKNNFDHKNDRIRASNQYDLIKTNYQSMNTYILGAIIFGLVVTLLWYSYSCFCENQNLITEPFIVKPIKTGIDDDLVFDVDGEVNKLRRLQEKYLVTLNAKRNR